jgi:hypothetical protein
MWSTAAHHHSKVELIETLTFMLYQIDMNALGFQE